MFEAWFDPRGRISFCFIETLSITGQKFSKTLFTWSGGPRSSGVGFFCFHALRDTKQKKPTRPGSPTPRKQGQSVVKMAGTTAEAI